MGTESFNVDQGTETAALVDDITLNAQTGVVAYTELVGKASGTPTEIKANSSGALIVDGSAVTQPVSDGGSSISVDDNGSTISIDDGAGSITVDGTVTVSGVATETTLGGVLTTSDFDTKAGSLTETAPASDTASSGLNGRLQRIAQRLTSLIALLPTSLGQKTMANGLAVTVASDQTVIPVSDNSGSLTVDNGGTFAVQAASTQSGTWTVQPGNTANTTAWKVDGSAVAQPITDNSGSLTVDQPTGSNLHTVLDSGTLTTLTGITNVVHVDDNSGSLTVDNAGTFAVQAASTLAAETTKVIGTTRSVGNVGGVFDAVAGAVAPANVVYGGHLAKTALPTAESDGDSVAGMSDKFGRQVILPGTIRDLVGTQTTTISSSTAETTIVTAVASTFLDLTTLIFSNTSATATRVDLRDTTAGSVLFSFYVPAGDTRGVSFQRPIPQTSVNTNWTAQSSASIADLRVYAVFDKNK